MKLLDALEKIHRDNIIDVPFEILFKDISSTDLLIKGNVGKFLEILLGLENGSSLLDFEDGELKTNKAKINGLPNETMFITQISKQVDELLGGVKFEDSRVGKKISRLIYLPVVKIGDPRNWYFKKPIYFELANSGSIQKQLEEDFYSVIEQMKNHIANDGQLHTSSGHYIQIRTKDGKPYHPIFSDVYNSYISNKNFAFYFKKTFMTELLKRSEDYPEIN